VTIVLAIPIATLQLPRQDRAMPRSQNPAAPQQVASLLALATKLLGAGRPADAIAPLRQAALLQPSNPIIQHDLGLACLEVGRVPDAAAALQRAVASNPRYTDAYSASESPWRSWATSAGPLLRTTAPLSCSHP
jgi:predicted Zn-dependent protease